ncbi:MAG: glycosyltransferase [Pseudomonadota bacterium]|nr:glycosyltransferase [Pseudomonadota bacterium]
MSVATTDGLQGRTVLCVIVGHFASAPRAQKEARALRVAGARVYVRGVWSDSTLAREDLGLAQALDVDFAPVVDLRSDGAGSFGDRARQRIAQEAFRRFGIVSSRVLGPGAPEMLRTARRIDADLTIVHSEPGLWVARALLARGARVAVDFEDWFSRDQLPADRPEPVRAVLRKLERDLLARAHACTTTTHVMAEALAADARTERVPAVVPNCFPAIAQGVALSGAADRVTPGVVSFYWFSRTIGPGRGLESLARALPLLRGEWQLTLRGSLHGHRDWFEATFPSPMRHRIHCVEPVDNAELSARTRSHDVGLALELPYCDNKQLTASNKIHEYLRGGLAVIATRTRGQQEVMAASPGAGMLVDAEDPVALAAAMQCMIDEPSSLRICRSSALHAGTEAWDWARHELTLVTALSGALA